jgi:hypothetical protein
MFQAAAWIVLGIFSLIRLHADYLLVVGVCLSLSIANIVGFTKCNKGERLLLKRIPCFSLEKSTWHVRCNSVRGFFFFWCLKIAS